MSLLTLWTTVSRTMGLERKTKKKVGKAVKVNCFVKKIKDSVSPKLFYSEDPIGDRVIILL